MNAKRKGAPLRDRCAWKMYGEILAQSFYCHITFAKRGGREGGKSAARRPIKSFVLYNCENAKTKRKTNAVARKWNNRKMRDKTA